MYSENSGTAPIGINAYLWDPSGAYYLITVYWPSTSSSSQFQYFGWVKRDVALSPWRSWFLQCMSHGGSFNGNTVISYFWIKQRPITARKISYWLPKQRKLFSLFYIFINLLKIFDFELLYFIDVCSLVKIQIDFNLTRQSLSIVYNFSEGSTTKQVFDLSLIIPE